LLLSQGMFVSLAFRYFCGDGISYNRNFSQVDGENSGYCGWPQLTSKVVL